ncbi:MAG TPA: YicC/YloC family endoribonuclease [Burkholderiales bacterium]|nr:YicC/YloC family endoribonuclease [Burkholderiales bacterium]
MTGYASVMRDIGAATLSVELRSVNHRYLDVQFRVPEEVRPFESGLREMVVARVQRGKVECRIGLGAAAGAQKSFELNPETLRQLRALSEQLRLAWPSVAGLTADDILHWPGVLGSDTLAAEQLRDACFDALRAALDEFSAARAREGERLAAVLAERAAAMEKLVAGVAPRMPQVIATFRDKLAARLREAMAGGDDERVRQEIALFASRIDVDEELSRLAAHLGEVKRVLAAGGAAGKRLDFLMQELNREANTLASKSADLEVTNVALELKLLIEQMREQIQNIE